MLQFRCCLSSRHTEKGERERDRDKCWLADITNGKHAGCHGNAQPTAGDSIKIYAHRTVRHLDLSGCFFFLPAVSIFLESAVLYCCCRCRLAIELSELLVMLDCNDHKINWIPMKWRRSLEFPLALKLNVGNVMMGKTEEETKMCRFLLHSISTKFNTNQIKRISLFI